jgi:hypothetical protein
MKRMRILGLALVAVFALAAVVASGASASPTWTECAKTVKNAEGHYTGTYTDKLCTVEATEAEKAEGKHNKYELKEGLGKKGATKPFKVKGGAATLHVIIPATGKGAFPGGAHVEVKCTSFKGSGLPALPNKVKEVVSEFKGCTVLAAPCQSGSKKGTITTNSLSGEMIDIEGGSGVGTELQGEASPVLANFTCTEVATTNVLGSVIAEHTGNVGVISKESQDHFVVGPGLGEVEYAPGAKYTPLVNIPTHKTGGPNGEHFLLSEITEAGHTEPAGTLPSGQEGTANDKGEALMIKP